MSSCLTVHMDPSANTMVSIFFLCLQHLIEIVRNKTNTLQYFYFVYRNRRNQLSIEE